ncbi:MAG: tetratricopeptide repeat protein [Deltaproteobacteria bacterium]|nr:tetratricopeptide repeat protein [Deltaproteobacteria bacterium]
MALYEKLPTLSLKKEGVLQFFQERKGITVTIILSLLILVLLVAGGPVLIQQFKRQRVAKLFEQVSVLHKKAAEEQLKGDWEAATADLERAVVLKENPLADYSLFLLALCYEKKGDRQKAITLYEEILSGEGHEEQSPFKELARQKKIWLKAGL